MDVACDCDALGQIELASKQSEAELESLKRISLASKILNPMFTTPRLFSFASPPPTPTPPKQPESAPAVNEWKPKFPQYRKQSDRMKSFVTWPKQMNPKPEELAKAGFFYEGVSDSCCCFHCGLYVHNWESDDDAIEEHFRHQPKCNFVAYLM